MIKYNGYTEEEKRILLAGVVDLEKKVGHCQDVMNKISMLGAKDFNNSTTEILFNLKLKILASPKVVIGIDEEINPDNYIVFTSSPIIRSDFGKITILAYNVPHDEIERFVIKPYKHRMELDSIFLGPFMDKFEIPQDFKTLGIMRLGVWDKFFVLNVVKMSQKHLIFKKD